MEGNRKFVRNHYMPSLGGFVTCFMDDDLTIIHGFCILKKSNLIVLVCSFVNTKLEGCCLTFKNNKLVSLDLYEEGEVIDQPLAYR